MSQCGVRSVIWSIFPYVRVCTTNTEEERGRKEYKVFRHIRGKCESAIRIDNLRCFGILSFFFFLIRGREWLWLRRADLSIRNLNVVLVSQLKRERKL